MDRLLFFVGWVAWRGLTVAQEATVAVASVGGRLDQFETFLSRVLAGVSTDGADLVDPADVSGLTFSGSPSQAECEALRDATADLAQAVRDLQDKLNAPIG